MIDIENYSDFFDDYLTADSKSFSIINIEKYKEGGQIKSKETSQKVELVEVNSPIDLILNNQNFEVIDYYPKTIFKKLFGKKTKLEFDQIDRNSFIFASEKTSKLFSLNATTHILQEDDKIIIGKRTMLVTYQDGDKLYAWSEPSSYKTILLR